MKKTILASMFLTHFLAFSQVCIGKTSITNTSISLEFYDNIDNEKGIILPWVTSEASVTGAVDGTMIYDITDKKIKYKKAGSWVDLTRDATGVVDTSLQDPKTELLSAKVGIGSNAGLDNTPGVLVLSDSDKAMVLPKIASPHLKIINPAAGMMVYDTTARQLAVYNGSVWSYWKP